MPRKVKPKPDFWQEAADHDAAELSKPHHAEALSVSPGYKAVNLGSMVKGYTDEVAANHEPYVRATLTIKHHEVNRMGRKAMPTAYQVQTEIPFLLKMTYATTGGYNYNKPVVYRVVFALSPAVAISTVQTGGGLLSVEVVDCDVWYVTPAGA